MLLLCFRVRRGVGAFVSCFTREKEYIIYWERRFGIRWTKEMGVEVPQRYCS